MRPMIEEFLNSLPFGTDANDFGLSDTESLINSDELMSDAIDSGYSSIYIADGIEQINDLSNYGMDENISLSSSLCESDIIHDDICFESNVGITDTSFEYAELNHSGMIEPTSDCLEFGQNELDTLSSNSNDISDISFGGNIYDDKTADFLKECDKLNIKLPPSVTHYDSYIDSSYNGGLMEIDKTLIRTSLKDALDNGKISKDEYDKLNNQLNPC